MSLEQAIIDHTAAIRELIAAMNANAAVANTVATQEKTPTTAKEAIDQATAAAKEAKAKKEAEAAAKKAAAETAAKTEEKALDYDKDIAPALTAFLKKHGRDAFATLLTPFGAKKGGEIKADDYAAVLAAIDEHELTA